jgi:hypothetical protein
VQVLQMIPENNHVGLITFGTHVHVHELGYAECSKAFVFRGSKEYTSSQVRTDSTPVQQGAQRQLALRRRTGVVGLFALPLPLVPVLLLLRLPGSAV